MIKHVYCFLCLLLCTGTIMAQKPALQWGQRVSVSHVMEHPDTTYSHYGAQYGRMLPLGNSSWLAAYTVGINRGYRRDPEGGLALEISISHNNGLSWEKRALIRDPGRDLDNAQMIALKDGSILLACRSVRWQESYRLPVYRSTDKGLHWERYSMIDTAEGQPGQLGNPDKGIYEPHFYFLGDGRLSVMYASEKHVVETPSYSQIISQRISPDNGRTWGKEIWVAYEPGHHASRPGMPVWTRMKNGKYIVAYEICGPEKCNIYCKTSNDGYHWPVGLGTPVPEQLGAPYILSLSDGRLVLTSNKSNISVSQDYGASWQLQEKAWPTTLWPALYEIKPGVIAVMTGVPRPAGGHDVQIRLGRTD